MNLSLEYLVRNNLVASFIDFPCSLFLENKEGDKAAIRLSLSDSDVIFELYDLQKIITNSDLPTCQKFKCDRADMLKDCPHLTGFVPIKYQEQSIRVSSNLDNHPMSEKLYLSYVENQLNSRAHKLYKSDWLWLAFTKLFFPLIKRHNTGKRAFIDVEQHFIEVRHRALWCRWRVWVDQFLFDNKVATELVFLKA